MVGRFKSLEQIHHNRMGFNSTLPDVAKKFPSRQV